MDRELHPPLPVSMPSLIALTEQTGAMAWMMVNLHGEWASSPHALYSMLSPGQALEPGSNLLDLVHPRDQSECAATLTNVIHSGNAEVKRFRLQVNGTGGIKTVNCQLVFTPNSQLPAECRDYFSGSCPSAIPQLCVIAIPKENESLCSKGLQEHKLVNLGALSAGIAHDLNNLMTGMGAFTHLLRSEIQDSKLLKYLGSVEKTIEKSAKLTHSITDYLREDMGPPKPVNPVQCLRDITYIIKRSLSQGITLSTCLSTKNLPVAIKRSELNQVFLNLLINARDAIEGQGTISMRASYEPSSDPKEFVLSVEDSGSGIQDHHAALIFDPFFTTKSETGGTGLGLTVISTIVKRAGGTIHVNSLPGKHTCFTVRLPIAKS